VCILFFQPLVLDPELSTLDFEEREVGSGYFITSSFCDRAVTIGDAMELPCLQRRDGLVGRYVLERKDDLSRARRGGKGSVRIDGKGWVVALILPS
jgi:hypothetical protein